MQARRLSRSAVPPRTADPRAPERLEWQVQRSSRGCQGCRALATTSAAVARFARLGGREQAPSTRVCGRTNASRQLEVPLTGDLSAVRDPVGTPARRGGRARGINFEDSTDGGLVCARRAGDGDPPIRDAVPSSSSTHASTCFIREVGSIDDAVERGLRTSKQAPIASTRSGALSKQLRTSRGASRDRSTCSSSAGCRKRTSCRSSAWRG